MSGKKPLTEEEILKQLDTLLGAYCGLAKDDLVKTKIANMEANLSSDQSSVVSQLGEQYITVNVGGKLFPTTMNTLKAVLDSRLDKIVTGRLPIQLDDDGNLFIDRNPDYFSYVLEYLRDGTVIYPQDAYQKTRVRNELKYFECLNSAKKQFQLDTSCKTADLKVSDDMCTVWKEGYEGNSVILGNTELTTGEYEWSVEITKKSPFYVQCFGVCSKTTAVASSLTSFYNANYPGVTTQAYTNLLQPYQIPILNQGDVINFWFNADTKEFKAECKARAVNCSGFVSGTNLYPFFYLYGNGDKIVISFNN